MNVGVTATADEGGLTRVQLLVLRQHLVDLAAAFARDEWLWLLHGCCTGGDEQLARAARQFGYRLHGFPGRGLLDPQRSLILNDRLEPVPSTKTPELTRNRNIVAAADILLVGPSGFTEKRRSGTWATYRYALAAGLPLVIVYPDGTQNMEFAGKFAPGATKKILRQGIPPVS